MGRRRGEGRQQKGRQQTEEKDDADRDAFTYSKSAITLVYKMYRKRKCEWREVNERGNRE